ncbi:MAG: DUF4286 family protein [Aquirufa sp.]
MIQFNLSLFVENSIHENAILALQKIVIPELEKQNFIDQIYLFEIESHQEPDSKGYSLQFWLPNFDEAQKVYIESIISEFFLQEFANQYVYFPSQLRKI